MRRSKDEVAASILKSCISDALSISQLMAVVNLPHKLLKYHLDRLLSFELIQFEIVGRRRRISATEKGIHVLKYYRNAVAVLNGVVGLAQPSPNTIGEVAVL